ncbi:hypothetical protein AB0F81_41770 [Actinoplanes sp. NPDC024001]|uniref:hypothetical protein n=1 Tax=Actinoplanes sp. NPDC024001 TaxID=3154598 RepID=UPI0033F7E070
MREQRQVGRGDPVVIGCSEWLVSTRADQCFSVHGGVIVSTTTSRRSAGWLAKTVEA